MIQGFPVKTKNEYEDGILFNPKRPLLLNVNLNWDALISRATIFNYGEKFYFAVNIFLKVNSH